MFVKQSVHDEVVAQNEQLTAEVARLQGLVDAATARTTELETSNTALTSEAETLRETNTQLQSQVETLNTSVTALTQENETLCNLPGSTTATSTTSTENNHGEAKSELDILNEFCEKNAHDVNACTRAIAAYNKKFNL